MQIQLAKETDKLALLSLWQEAFGDSEETIETFFKLCFQPQNILIATEQGNLVAALYLLETTLHTKSQNFNLYYVYAAATKKDFRKRGAMTALLSFAKEIAQKRKKDALYLVPASESLFDYYEKRGYQKAFLKDVYTLEIVNLPLKDKADEMYFPILGEYQFQREKALKNIPHFIFPTSLLQLHFYFAKQFALPIYVTKYGFCSVDTEKNILHLTEFCVDFSKQKEMLSALSSQNQAKYIEVSMPHGTEFAFPMQPKSVYAGMILPLSEKLSEDVFKSAYLGITLG